MRFAMFEVTPYLPRMISHMDSLHSICVENNT